MTGGATAGSGRDFRLDPSNLPVRQATVLKDGQANIDLDRDRAVLLHRRARDGQATSIPIDEFGGVSVRIASAIPETTLVIELMHDDPDCVIELARGQDPEELASDWQAWGRKLGLPLLVVAPDGSVQSYGSFSGAVCIGAPKPRRRHSYFAGRRPRFLTRRKIGHGSRPEQLQFREIIARD